MLDEGAGTRSALEIADAVEFLGASLVTSGGMDASAVRMNVPVARLADGLPLLADVVLRPTFPAADLERLRQERLTALLQAQDDPASIASLAFSRLVFGSEHRYGTPGIGTRAALEAIADTDVRGFHARHYTVPNATLIVVGDVGTDDVIRLLEPHFGVWRPASEARTTPAAPKDAPQVPRAQIYLVDKPGAPQSQIRLGWVGAPRATDDYFTLQVLNTILGGAFTSRLNQNLRETHGYAYGAGSRFEMYRGAGPFFATAGVQADKTADALQEFFKELNAIGEPIGDEELTKGKNYLALQLPSALETTSDLSLALEEMVTYGLPADYLERYVPNVQAVTSAAVQQAAAKYIQPSRFIVVVVGDGKLVEAPLRATKLGPVTVLTVVEALGR
jgi:predicted Zn-dependent peptidase